MNTEAAVNSFRMKREDDGAVTLEFGHRERAEDSVAPPDPGHGFVTVQRVVLTPLAAWRLVAGLSQALRRPAGVAAPAATAGVAASASAAVAAPSAPPTHAAATRRTSGTPGTSLDLGVDEPLRQRGSTPLNLPHDPMAEAADWLRAAVADMAPQHFQERSFRLAPGRLQANRFLLSINSAQLPADALERSWAICRHLGLPQALRGEVEQAFAGAAHVHFGFEGEPERTLCKLYLERRVDALEAARARESGVPAPLYTSFKWDTARGHHVVSLYHLWPGLGAGGMAERIERAFAGADPALVGHALAVLDACAQRLPGERLQYLEVTEPGQPRLSFDLNAYDAGLTLRDLQPVLFALRDHFGIAPGRFQALYDQVKGKRFGHLAGGIHRDGRPFFNVYYGGARQG